MTIISNLWCYIDLLMCFGGASNVFKGCLQLVIKCFMDVSVDFTCLCHGGFKDVPWLCDDYLNTVLAELQCCFKNVSF